MAIINLGQIGEQRESWAKRTSKYTDALIEAKATQAKTEEARADKSRTYFREAYKNYWKKGDSERGMFDQLPEGKQFHKAAKRYIPDWYDAEGKPIRYPIEKELTKEEQNLVAVDLERMKRNLPPSPEGASSIIKMIQYQMDYGEMDPKEGAEAIKFYMKFIQPSRYSGAMAGGGQGEVGAGVNQADPLNILGR